MSWIDEYVRKTENEEATMVATPKIKKVVICKKIIKEIQRESINNGARMSIDQIREYLQQYCGRPVAMREKGSTMLDKCPYCTRRHESELETGYQPALCNGDDSNGITVNGRQFRTGYGLIVFEYETKDDVNEVIGHN